MCVKKHAVKDNVAHYHCRYVQSIPSSMADNENAGVLLLRKRWQYLVMHR